ncbi:MAG: carbon dioxide concentrating mechanism protein [Elainellaceae cyanobacterium]
MSHLIRSPSSLSDAHFYISGNVTVHPSAAIAPSVMLQADPDSQLTVAAGACIGAGCILHAYQGTLEIAAGATLGSSVLIIGRGTIGADACIGSMTTIIDSSVPANQIVPPGSLIGDQSRRVALVEASEPYTAPGVPSTAAAPAPEPPQPEPTEPPKSEATPPEPSPEPSEEASADGVRVVYGRTYIERMMFTMFPHRQSQNDQ